ncbi:MAG: capsid cement protein, partial [Rhodanobacter sp.]
MSQSRAILTLSVLATAAIVANTFVTVGGAVAALKGNTFGVARTNGASGDLVPVDVLGTAQVIASAAIAKGASVQSTATGQAATAATGGVVVA